MPSPLIRDMIERHAYPLLGEDSVDAFLQSNQDTVLFFTGDPKQFPEADDVAVILPELVNAFAGRLVPAVVSTRSERKLQARYRFTTWPSLVFLRRGSYLGTISKVQDWHVYLNDIQNILDSVPGEPPPFDFNKACAGAA